MSAINRVSIVATSAALSLWASIAPAVTVQDFDSPGTAYTLSQFGSAPGPAVVGGGNPGSAVRWTDAGSGGQNNTVAFDRADVGVAHIVTASYDFNIAAGGAADGFALALLNTTSFGIAGAGPTFSEEPALAGSLGFAYDTFDNGGEGFRSATVYFNGVLISNTPTTDYVDGLYHHVSILANMDAGTVSYQIDNNVI